MDEERREEAREEEAEDAGAVARRRGIWIGVGGAGVVLVTSLVLFLMKPDPPLSPNYPNAELVFVDGQGKELRRCTLSDPKPAEGVQVLRSEMFQKKVRFTAAGRRLDVMWSYQGRDGSTDRYHWRISLDDRPPRRPVTSYNGRPQGMTVYSEGGWKLMLRLESQEPRPAT